MHLTPTTTAELSNVTRRYGKIIALDGVHLSVQAGELLALLGPNGAGKTTAISLLLGLQQPDSGTARLFGESPLVTRVRRRVGVMMQEVALAPELRVREHLELVSSYYPDPIPAQEVLQMTATTALADRPYRKLSSGQKRQAQFALAVCGRPQLLFLDEPTAGLDIHSRELMWAAVRELVAGGCSIVLTTHYLEEAEALADRVVVLARGRTIASGTVSELRSLVVRKHIRCATVLDAAGIRAWPEVLAVDRDQYRLRITAAAAEPVVRRLLAADPGLSELEIERAGLAEAFTELTRESIQ
jgi:ABC-2 type transport system ATP-binding protein